MHRVLGCKSQKRRQCVRLSAVFECVAIRSMLPYGWAEKA